MLKKFSALMLISSVTMASDFPPSGADENLMQFLRSEILAGRPVDTSIIVGLSYGQQEELGILQSRVPTEGASSTRNPPAQTGSQSSRALPTPAFSGSSSQARGSQCDRLIAQLLSGQNVNPDEVMQLSPDDMAKYFNAQELYAAQLLSSSTPSYQQGRTGSSTTAVDDRETRLNFGGAQPSNNSAVPHVPTSRPFGNLTNFPGQQRSTGLPAPVTQPLSSAYPTPTRGSTHRPERKPIQSSASVIQEQDLAYQQGLRADHARQDLERVRGEMGTLRTELTNLEEFLKAQLPARYFTRETQLAQVQRQIADANARLKALGQTTDGNDRRAAQLVTLRAAMNEDIQTRNRTFADQVRRVTEIKARLEVLTTEEAEHLAHTEIGL